MDRRISDMKDDEERVQKTIVGETTKIKGDFISDDDIVLHGKFEGKLKSKSLLFVKRNGKIKGEVRAGNMILAGEVEGEIAVSNKIEVRKNARFTGSVKCDRIAIEEGAFFQGDVNKEDGKEVTPTYFKEKRKDVLKE